MIFGIHLSIQNLHPSLRGCSGVMPGVQISLWIISSNFQIQGMIKFVLLLLESANFESQLVSLGP